MARMARLTAAGWLHQVVHRGHNRQAIALDEQDRAVLHGWMLRQAAACELAIHSYAILDNELRLLATPAADASLAAFMQSVGRGYVRAFNRRHQRSGTLWEGRYRCNVIEPEPYALAAMVLIDRAAQERGLVAQASDWLWSSCAHALGLRSDALLTPHAAYWRLGNTPFAREAAYGQLLQDERWPALAQALEQAAWGGWALGGDEFVAELQKRMGQRRVSRGRAGRPRKAKEAPWVSPSLAD